MWKGMNAALQDTGANGIKYSATPRKICSVMEMRQTCCSKFLCRKSMYSLPRQEKKHEMKVYLPVVCTR